MEYIKNGHSPYSRWASPNEVKDSLHKLQMNGDFDYGGIPLYCESGDVFVEKSDTHSLIVGATGSKKTRLIGMPSLQIYTRAGESFVATDPKGELYERTLPLLKEQGYEVFVLNLRDTQQSHGWNPFIVPYKLYKNGLQDRALESIIDMANCICVEENRSIDPYWCQSNANLFSGLLLLLFECAQENEVHLKSLRALRTQAFQNDTDSNKNNRDNTPPFIVERFLKHLDKSAFIFSLLNGTADVADITRGCIISTFDQVMRPFFCQNNLIDTLSVSDLDMSSIGQKKTAVFLIFPDENSVYYRLISIFIKQCYTELIYEAQKQPTKRLPIRVNFLLDEFSSLPRISDFPNMITAARSRNIRFNLMIQSFNQLQRWYGSDSETIKGNCENWIFLHSREVSLLQELVKLSGCKGNEEPLVSMSLLQTLNKEKGEAFIIHKRLNPFIANLMDIDQYNFTFADNSQIQYPRNERQALDVFDFEEYCKGKDSYFFSQLFDGKKITEEDFYMNNDEVSVEPLFSSKLPSQEELDAVENRIRGSENKDAKETAENTEKNDQDKIESASEHIKTKKEEKMKKISKKEFKKILKKMPSTSIEARKKYASVELMSRMKNVCSMNYDEFSDQVLMRNFELVGKRLGYMKYEFTKKKCKRIIKKSINYIVRTFPKKDRASAKKNILWVLNDYKNHKKDWV